MLARGAIGLSNTAPVKQREWSPVRGSLERNPTMTCPLRPFLVALVGGQLQILDPNES